MSDDFQVIGEVAEADFTLKIHRGEGMALLAMNWKAPPPPDNFVGFAIEYSEPVDPGKFYPLKNRLNFEGEAGSISSSKRPPTYSTLVAPIQKFRWVHFPRFADQPGLFTYRVKPVFMSDFGDLSYGLAQTAAIVLARETYPGALNVAFTRGFVSSQAFVDNYLDDGPISTLLPATADEGLEFKPTHKDTAVALAWMGFEARRDIIEVLKAALADATAKVGVIAYDLNLPEIVDCLSALGARARVIIDDSDDHHNSADPTKVAEDKAATLLAASGVEVRRQKMGKLQHNKTIVVDGQAVQTVVCGSTNMSWRGFFVQSNNALILTGAAPVRVFAAAFESYWTSPDTFDHSPSAEWQSLGLDELDAQVAFSPHSQSNSVLKGIADDLRTARSSIFYSLAFLSITPGKIRTALALQTNRADLFVSGISDKHTGVQVASSSSNFPPTYVAALDRDAPSPFREEPVGGGGTRMHHKFIVIDFDKPGARVYLGSYNMSVGADGDNGENLVLIRDRRVATSYMIEALRIIDHYQFRVLQKDRQTRRASLTLQRSPAAAHNRAPQQPVPAPWWATDFTDPHRIKDRELFA